MLRTPAPALCLQCHDEKNAGFQAKHLGRDGAGVNCTTCHEPHHASQPSLLRANAHPGFAERACDTCHQGPGTITTPKELCLQCHDSLVPTDLPTGRQHAPFADGDCLGCHNPHAASGKALLPAGPVVDVCATCHDPASLYPDSRTAHTPVREGRCDACHDPHGTPQPALLSEAPGKLCFTCHVDLQAEQRRLHVHAPFAQGRCSECHDPHGTAQTAGLVAPPRELCGKCHQLDSPALTAKHRGFSLVDADCRSCHAPHASATAGLAFANVHRPYAQGNCAACHPAGSAALRGTESTLCLSCHPGLAQDLKAGRPHGPLAGEKSCTPCHNPHTAPAAPLLPARQAQVCGRCHAAQATTANGAAHRHPEQGGKGCTTCHDPHVSPPAGELAISLQATCVGCHSFKEHANHPMGDKVIDPRTKKPLTCVSCHDPHGSAFEKMLRDDPGGRLCVPCHTEKVRPKRSP